MTFLTIFQKCFPHFIPTCFQQDVMQSAIQDLDAWQSTVEFWALNDYRPQSIGKMLEYYADEVGRQHARKKAVLNNVLPTFEEKMADMEVNRSLMFAPPTGGK